MIDLCYQKMKDIWYCVAIQDNQTLATSISTEEPDLRHPLQRLPQHIPFQVTEEPNQLLTEVLKALDEIFNGKDRESYGFNLDINHLSTYAQKVLNCTRLVPVGYVTTYGAIAKVVGGTARSVGRSEASNPVPLLIPCHRVVCSDFKAGGYGYGEQIKMEILQREERGYEESKRLKVEDKELSLFPVKWVIQKQEEVLRS